MTGIVLDIADIAPAFPDYRVALVVAEGLDLAGPRDRALAARIGEIEAEARSALDGTAMGEVPEITAWREAYKGFGIRKTSYRSSVERLLRIVTRGEALAEINPLVDLYNSASVRFRMPIGADDLDKLAPPLAFRYAREGDSFFALGREPAENDPPKSGEVVYADAEKLLCRRWNWYQDGRSATSAATRRAVLTVQHIGEAAALEHAAATLCAWIEESCGGRAEWVVAHAAAPVVALPQRG